MKANAPLVLVMFVAFVAGCAEKETVQANAQKKVEAGARAEAARKEMKTLPEAFRPRYNKRLEPEAVPAKDDTQTKKP